MKKILCLTDSLENLSHIVKDAQLLFFPIEQLDPDQHSFSLFNEIYEKLESQTDLSEIDLVIAEYIEAVPLVYFMRKNGHFCPAIFIPHTNAYPFNILFYFLMVSQLSHSGDLILCGSVQAANAYQRFVNIRALPICTFGIKSWFQKGDKIKARKQLGLPHDEKIILYTGRFMNDKGLTSLLNIYDKLKKRLDNLLLVLSITHFDSSYYNPLAFRLRDAVIFYRLESSQMLSLYQSADLFVSLATSIFETYGKSPMEAISCGVPAVLPNWDGFRYYINENNGSLARVIYSDTVEDIPYSFAYVDEEDFMEKSYNWLLKEGPINYDLPKWAYYEHTVKTIAELLKNVLRSHFRFFKKPSEKTKIDFSCYPEIIHQICLRYDIESFYEFETKAESAGLINRDDPGDLILLRALHDQLFQTMDDSLEKISEGSEVLQHTQ